MFPLTVLGTIIGIRFAGQANHPVAVSPIPSRIPDKLWYLELPVVVAVAGLFPFGSIFTEIYYIFSSVWAYKVYYLYGILLLSFMLLVLVTIAVNIVSAYLVLNCEDHRWFEFLVFASHSLALSHGK